MKVTDPNTPKFDVWGCTAFILITVLSAGLLTASHLLFERGKHIEQLQRQLKDSQDNATYWKGRFESIQERKPLTPRQRALLERFNSRHAKKLLTY